ncbi:MAG: hypothetical protein WA816_06390 [Bacteroidales bacterium]
MKNLFFSLITFGKKAGGNLVITAPLLTPDDNQLAYVFKRSD